MDAARAFGLSEQGPVRARNDDRFLVRELGGGLLLAVADGMGGAARGDLAAQAAVDVLAAFSPDPADPPGSLLAALETAGRRIAALSGTDPELHGMGTTATAALLLDGEAHWAHVGDSRLYHLSGRDLRQVTHDHRFLQDFLDDGSLTPEEVAVHPLRNVLDRCLGCRGEGPEAGSFAVAPGDWLLLCSDGLTLHLQDAEIRRRLLAAGDAEAAVRDLLRAALADGGRDNATAVAARAGAGG